MSNTLDFLAPKDAWDKLSMREQAEMMKVAVKNGVYDLATIRQKYNEFAEGGNTQTDWSYNSWKKQIAEHMGIRPNEDNTYDYEAFFKKYPEEAWRMLKGDPTAHFSDEFKTVYHPTFSSKSIGNDGSIYSGVKNPKTNPQGLVGGTWSPDYHTFTMSPDGYRGPVSMDDRKWYLENAEDSGVQLREANGSLPIYDNIPWAGVLPTVTVTGNKHSIGGPLVEAAVNEYKSGGGIYIKPSHRGRLTELKKRTGKSEAELYNDGNPAHKKMVVFARNARKWKHGLGGNLFDGTSQPSQKMQIGLNVQGWPNYTTEQIIANGERIQQQRKAIQDAYLNFVTESNDATAVANGRPQNKHLEERGIKGAKAHATWEKEHPILTAWSYLPSAAVIGTALAPLGATGWSGLTALGDAAAATSTGQAITAGLAPLATAASTNVAGVPLYTWADAGLTSLFGGHGVQTAIDEGGVSPMTALEVAPMVVRTGVEAANTYNKLRQYSRLEKNYTGVPHKQADGTSVYMDESFPGVHRQHTVWATDDADYGRMFTVTRDAKGNVVRDKNGKIVYGKLFDVYTDPKELSVLETPKVPDGQMVYWQGLPYKLENGKVQYANNIAIKDNIIPKTKEIALKNKDNYGRYGFDDTGSYIWKDGEGSGVVVNWDQVPGAIKTDHVVQYSKDNGYHGTRFNKVYDGGVTLDKGAGFTFDYDLGDYYDYPINELVLNPGAPKYILTHNVPKYKVLNQLPNVFSQPKAPFGILPLINRKND